MKHLSLVFWYLPEYRQKIYLIVRDPKIISEPVNYRLMREKGDRVSVLMQTEVTELIEAGGKLAKMWMWSWSYPIFSKVMS